MTRRGAGQREPKGGPAATPALGPAGPPGGRDPDELTGGGEAREAAIPDAPTPRTRQTESYAPVVPCDLCGAPMLEVHCKLSCKRCGYQRDCSDP